MTSEYFSSFIKWGETRGGGPKYNLKKNEKRTESTLWDEPCGCDFYTCSCVEVCGITYGIWRRGGEKSEIEGTRAGARIDKCSRDEFGKVGDNHKTGAKKEEREKWISRTFPPLHLDSFRPLEMGVIPSRKLLRATLKGLKVYLPRCWC